MQPTTPQAPEAGYCNLQFGDGETNVDVDEVIEYFTLCSEEFPNTQWHDFSQKLVCTIIGKTFFSTSDLEHPAPPEGNRLKLGILRIHLVDHNNDDNGKPLRKLLQWFLTNSISNFFTVCVIELASDELECRPSVPTLLKLVKPFTRRLWHRIKGNCLSIHLATAECTLQWLCESTITTYHHQHRTLAHSKHIADHCAEDIKGVFRLAITSLNPDQLQGLLDANLTEYPGSIVVHHRFHSARFPNEEDPPYWVVQQRLRQMIADKEEKQMAQLLKRAGGVLDGASTLILE